MNDPRMGLRIETEAMESKIRGHRRSVGSGSSFKAKFIALGALLVVLAIAIAALVLLSSETPA